jgi:hypothetical protein
LKMKISWLVMTVQAHENGKFESNWRTCTLRGNPLQSGISISSVWREKPFAIKRLKQHSEFPLSIRIRVKRSIIGNSVAWSS